MDARLGQLLFHDLIVQARHLAGRLLAHIAGGHVQYRRDLGKNGQVEPCVALDHGGFVFQEITRERGVGDDIGAAVVQNDVGQMPHSLGHQPLADCKRHQAGVLADDKQMESITGGSRRFHQILVPQRKGVGVHDQRGRSALGFGLFEAAQVGTKTIPAVLHKDEGVLHPGDLVKAQIPKEFGAFTLGVQKQVEVAPGALHLNEVGDDLVEQALALMVAADGKAPQGVAKAAARADDVVILIEHGTDIIQIAVPADALFLQKGVDLSQGGFIGGRHLREGVFRHLPVPPF